jgi:hypothetical protein
MKVIQRSTGLGHCKSDIYQCFGETNWLKLRGSASILNTVCTRRQYSSPKRWYPPNRLQHGVITQTTTIQIFFTADKYQSHLISHELISYVSPEKYIYSYSNFSSPRVTSN